MTTFGEIRQIRQKMHRDMRKKLINAMIDKSLTKTKLASLLGVKLPNLCTYMKGTDVSISEEILDNFAKMKSFEDALSQS